MENILVSIRVRPLSKQEASKGTTWKLTPKSIALSSGVYTSGPTYIFDRVFDPSSKTLDIYDAHTKKIISSAVQGFNGTIFAYGQTSSGKTYTMRGSSEEPGIIPLAIEDVFRETELSKDREFLLRVSYMEIYNEEIKDLLAPEDCKLEIHENSEKGIFVAGLREVLVASPEQVLALMDLGEVHRHVGETNMNVHSSRSHAIFRMVIESRDRSRDEEDAGEREILPNSDPVRVSHLNLVDLAGSERVAKTGAEGARLKEGTHINKSLMTLGNVINKLSEGIEKQGGHVPYRDSKLTRILQPALGGNARTVIICNITPALVHVDETKGTLHFASRANRVTNCAQVNEIVTDAALLKRQKKEIAELRQKLQNQESPSEQFEDKILNLRNELLKTELERERMAVELQEFQKAQAEKERRIKEQEQKIENLSTMVINSAIDDRVFKKRSKRNNRRETWCARPQSGLLSLSPDLRKLSHKDVLNEPESTFSELPVHVRRERSYGLPPPFEALIEEDEDMPTSTSFDEGFQEIDDGFTLPEPGPQSSVAARRRRSSNDWIVGNELEEQLLDLQGQYDAQQCDHAIKMSEKDSEIKKLKTELVCTQLNLSTVGKDRRKKVHDPVRKGNSLDAWKESESLATIKQLRGQVGKVETEKLYMDRELQSLSNQAREVYEERNLAKETCVKLNAQLDTTQQEVQHLQMEKRESEVFYSQLSFAFEDLKTELDDIREPCRGLQSSTNESLQHLTTLAEACQECLEDARHLSALCHIVYENNHARPPSLTSKAGSLEDYTLAGRQPVELDEAYGCDRVTETSSEIAGTCSGQQRTSAEENKIAWQEGIQSLPWSVEEKFYPSDDARERQVSKTSGTIESEKKEEFQQGDRKDCETKHCYSVSLEQKPAVTVEFDRLQEDRNILLSAVGDTRMQIEHAASEKEILLLRKATLQDELENLKTCLKGMDDEKNSLSQTILQEESNILLVAANSLHTRIQNFSSEKETSVLRKAALQDELGNLMTCIKVLEDEKSSFYEINLQGEGERNALLSAVESLQKQIERASTENENFLVRKAALQEDLDRLKTWLQVMEGENSSFSESKRDHEEGSVEECQPGQSMKGLDYPESEYVCHEHVADDQVSTNESLRSLYAELSRLREENSSLGVSLASAQSESEWVAVDKQNSLLRESALGREVESLKAALHSVAEERNKFIKASDRVAEELGRLETVVEKLAIKVAAGFEKCDKHYEVSELSGANITMCILELETLLVAVKQAGSEEERLLLTESALSEELRNAKSSLQSVEDEKNSMSRRLVEIQSELESRRAELDTIARTIRSSQPFNNVSEEPEELSALLPEIERLIHEKRTLKDRVDVLCIDVLQSRKEIDRLSSREASLELEVTRLESSVEDVKDDRQLWMKVSEEKLVDIERLKVELENTRRTLLSTSEEFADAQEQLSDLKSSLSQKLNEVEVLNKRLEAVDEEEGRLNKRLEDLEEEKNTLTRTVGELDSQLQDFRVGAAEALKEMEQRYQTESTHYRAEIASLRREVSTAETLPGALLKERDGLHKDLEKTKFKLKDIEAKLKTTIQDKYQLETEKVNMERKLKHLRQSTALQRDISRRKSLVDQKRQPISQRVSRTKTQLSSVEHALHLKNEEVETLTYQLRQSHESYSKLEFAMAEAESYSNEKLVELEGALVALKDEKKAGFANLEGLQSEDDDANELCRAKFNELENLRNELAGMKGNLQESEGETRTAKALLTTVTKEKEDIVEELLDAHTGFVRKRAELTAQVQEGRENCNTLNRDIFLLTEELQKLKKLQEEASAANRVLQDKLQQALETSTEKSLSHHKRLQELVAEVESYKVQCRELQQHLKLSQKQEQELRLSGSSRLEQLKLELQQLTAELSTARDEEQMLSTENRSFLYTNTKLQVALDAARERLEIFEKRWEQSQWKLKELQSLLQKTGLGTGDEWNSISLHQLKKHFKAQNDEARRLETELASKKMEMIDLEVQLESMRAQCEKYEEEIQYLKTKVLTPEQEIGVREIVRENKILRAQLKKAEVMTQELTQLVKGKDVSLNAFQTTLGSFHAQNAKLQKELAASKAELESAQQPHEIAIRARSLMSNYKPVRPEKLQATSQSSISLPAESTTCTESSLPEYRVPLGEISSNELPCTEGKRARLFPASERSKLSRSLGLGPRPESRSEVHLNKENFALLK